MKKNISWPVLSSALACNCAMIACAHATPRADQTQLQSNIGIPTDPLYNVVPVSQSFTVGTAGKLTQMVVSTNGPAASSGSVTYALYAGADTSGQLLGSSTQVLPANSGAYDYTTNMYPVPLDLSRFNVVATAGQKYTVSITSTAGGYTRGILAASTNPYAGGRGYFGPGYGNQPQWDLMFITYINPLTNVALNKPVSQSSTAGGGVASRAVDGNLDGNWTGGSVTHTNVEIGAWWELDLQSTTTIDSVVLFNRTDCCTDRLSNFNVQLLDDQRALVRQFVYSKVAPATSNFGNPGGMRGRYVRIQLNGLNPLSLAEVMVLVDPDVVNTGP